MTEDILISVKGLHMMDGEQEDQVEVFSAGKYYLKNGKHYILYEEMEENTREVIKNRITLRGDCMEVQKSGLMTTKMVFEKTKKNMSWYTTPFGNLLAGIEVTSMNIREQEDLLEIGVDYELEVNYEKMADCRIEIRVMSKDSGLFSLR